MMSRRTSRDLEAQQPSQPPYAAHGSQRAAATVQPYHARKHSSPLPEHAARHFDDIDATSLQPPPSALTPSSATAYDPHAPSPLDDYPRSGRTTHQRSLTGTIFDNFNRATSTIQQHTSRASSPSKSLASFIPSRGTVESSASQPKIRAIQNWFTGSSPKSGSAQHDDDYSDSESASGEEYDSESESDQDEEEEEEEEEEAGTSMMSNIFTRAPLSRGAPPRAPRVQKPPSPSPRQSPRQSRPPSQPPAASLPGCSRHRRMPQSLPRHNHPHTTTLTTSC